MIVTALSQASSNLRVCVPPVFAPRNAFPRYPYGWVPHIALVFANMEVAQETSPDHMIYNHAALPSPYSLLPASFLSIIHHHQAHYRFVIYFLLPLSSSCNVSTTETRSFYCLVHFPVPRAEAQSGFSVKICQMSSAHNSECEAMVL